MVKGANWVPADAFHSRDAGRREAKFSFNVGQGTQDIGPHLRILGGLLDALPGALETLKKFGVNRLMVEGGAKEVAEADILAALQFASAQPDAFSAGVDELPAERHGGADAAIERVATVAAGDGVVAGGAGGSGQRLPTRATG